MQIFSLKLGHDRSMARVEDGRLVFSIDSEKDSLIYGAAVPSAALESLSVNGQNPRHSEYRADRSLRPPPVLELDVRPGDLVMIGARQLHAVARQVSSRRVGISCFLGYRCGKPLICWS